MAMQFDVTPLTWNDKAAIIALLKKKHEDLGNNLAATGRALPGVSEITIADMLKGDRANIEHCVWMKVGKAVGWTNKHKVKIIDTANSKTLLMFFTTAKEFGQTFAIVGPAGSGKSITAKHFAKANASKNVYLIPCAEFLNRTEFLKLILRVMNRNAGGKNQYEMMDEIVGRLFTQIEPVMIFDEIDKLRPDVLNFFITFYNQLNGICGIVWLSTDSIVNKIERGVKARKPGFEELFSRIGRKFIELPGVKAAEVREICKANDINDPEDIETAVNEFEGDLRRVDRLLVKNEMKKRRA